MPEIPVKARFRKPHVVIFAGGSGARSIQKALTPYCRITRILPVSDNGGSSRVLRQHFRILPVGDLRNALTAAMTSEIGEPAHSTVDIFEWRFRGFDDQRHRRQFQAMLDADHPEWDDVPVPWRQKLIGYMQHFLHMAGEFDFSEGCLGNFIITGALLRDGDINRVMEELTAFFELRTRVLPVSLNHELHLSASTDDGGRYHGQWEITMLNREHNFSRIQSVYYQPVASPLMNPQIVDVLDEADMVLFGPGSFFTSIMPHVLVDGVLAAVSRVRGPRIFLGNIVEGNECFGYTLTELVRVFYDHCRRAGIGDGDRVLTHVLGNEYGRQGKHHLALGDGDLGGAVLIKAPLEDKRNPGVHDAGHAAKLIMDIYHEVLLGMG